MGIDDVLRAGGTASSASCNGIDATVWDPAHDRHLAEPYDWGDMAGKAAARRAVLDELALPDLDGPLLVVVSRLVEQKGVDLLVPALDLVEQMPLQVAVLGDGDQALAGALAAAAGHQPQRVAFRQGYDDRLAHLLFAGGDLLPMPSRFEPCGLAQMQAMRYGTLPVVTDVGGLHDTVVDVDDCPRTGPAWLHDHRPRRAPRRAAPRCQGPRRAGAAQGHAEAGHGPRLVVGEPAREHLEHYEQLLTTGRHDVSQRARDPHRAEGARDRPGRG